MVCYHPLTAYQSVQKKDNGKREIIFNKQKARDHTEVKLPCGQCSGCRGKRAGEWAVRCAHEASLYSANCFITLTYSPEWLPDDKSLNVKHFQDFMKRLRKRFEGVDEIRHEFTDSVNPDVIMYIMKIKL